MARTSVSLQEVQHVLAREHGCRTWSELRAAAGSASSSADPDELRAAIDSDDVDAVRFLVESHPELLDQRWTYESLDGELSITDTPFGYAVPTVAASLNICWRQAHRWSAATTAV